MLESGVYLYDRIQTLNRDSSTPKANVRLGGSDKRESNSEPLHLCKRILVPIRCVENIGIDVAARRSINI